jgi:hypothetical protein
MNGRHSWAAVTHSLEKHSMTHRMSPPAAVANAWRSARVLVACAPLPALVWALGALPLLAACGAPRDIDLGTDQAAIEDQGKPVAGSEDAARGANATAEATAPAAATVPAGLPVGTGVRVVTSAGGVSSCVVEGFADGNAFAEANAGAGTAGAGTAAGGCAAINPDAKDGKPFPCAPIQMVTCGKPVPARPGDAAAGAVTCTQIDPSTGLPLDPNDLAPANTAGAQGSGTGQPAPGAMLVRCSGFQAGTGTGTAPGAPGTPAPVTAPAAGGAPCGAGTLPPPPIAGAPGAPQAGAQAAPADDQSAQDE